ncbi:unnamed protein product [Mytilus coruscus]|uniref:Uncharacterized protein n=1 Tax=Mytilus coruscus TaxID=42192 RepID=A0A6J8EHF8_MYTCO|nr:unnamed protein product [Mytilus coruscus]
MPNKSYLVKDNKFRQYQGRGKEWTVDQIKEKWRKSSSRTKLEASDFKRVRNQTGGGPLVEDIDETSKKIIHLHEDIDPHVFGIDGGKDVGVLQTMFPDAQGVKGDLNCHLEDQHQDVWKRFENKFPSEDNGYWFSVNPEDHRRLITPKSSSVAVQARSHETDRCKSVKDSGTLGEKTGLTIPRDFELVSESKPAIREQSVEAASQQHPDEHRDTLVCSYCGENLGNYLSPSKNKSSDQNGGQIQCCSNEKGQQTSPTCHQLENQFMLQIFSLKAETIYRQP